MTWLDSWIRESETGLAQAKADYDEVAGYNAMDDIENSRDIGYWEGRINALEVIRELYLNTLDPTGTDAANRFREGAVYVLESLEEIFGDEVTHTDVWKSFMPSIDEGESGDA